MPSARMRPLWMLAASLLVFCAGLSSSAGASLSINLAGGINGTGATGDNFSNPAVDSVYGRVSNGGSAFIENEGLWPEQERTCFGCGTTTSNDARSAGEILAADSRFRAHASVQTGGDTTFGTAFVDLVLTDTIHFNSAGPAIFDTHIGLDLDAFDFGFNGAGHAHFSFEVLIAPLLCPSGECEEGLFYFEARDYSNGNTLDGWASGNSRQDVDLNGFRESTASDDLALDFQRVFQVAAAGDYMLTVRAHSQAICDPGSSSCSADVDFSNTGYLGITGDFTSANGYRYPGYAAVVPEPSTALLVATGLGLLGARRPRRSGER